MHDTELAELELENSLKELQKKFKLTYNDMVYLLLRAINEYYFKSIAKKYIDGT